MKLSPKGALMPLHGFSRYRPPVALIADATTWRSHDGIVVLSALSIAPLPGTDDLHGPSWHLSVSHFGQRPTPEQTLTAIEAFAMPAYDEDNHHPGIARHLWCPVDEEYRNACECKLTEDLIVDGDYEWTNDTTQPCRGCAYADLAGAPCPIHGYQPTHAPAADILRSIRP